MGPGVRDTPGLTEGVRMCIFSQPVASVSGTRIFARESEGTQWLVYQMDLTAPAQLAMVLPLPTARIWLGNPVSFIDLSGHPRFFDDLRDCFSDPRHAEVLTLGIASGSAPLPVHRVGSFDASYVPGASDFKRLDPRFRLRPDLLSALSRYGDWGFVVFKFQPMRGRVHPMALKFRSRESGMTFFPTVHVHDGSVPEYARFDHTLYLQGSVRLEGWKQASTIPGRHAWSARYARGAAERALRGLIDADVPLQRGELIGDFENVDCWLPSG